MTARLDRPLFPAQNGATRSMSTPQRQPLQTRDLWRSVDRLTKDRTQRLARQTAPGQVTVEYVPIPSLLTQLREALASNNSSDGRPGKSTGSRAPLDLAIASLIGDMSQQIRAALLKLGGRPRILTAAPTTGPGRAAPTLVDELGYMLVAPDVAGQLLEAAARAQVRTDTSRLRHDVPTDLRQLATALIGTGDQALVDRWTGNYHTWVSQAETILTDDDEAIDLRGIRGHTCPACGTDHVERVEPSNDPRAVDGVERFHDPALVIAFRDGQVQHITCRACDTGWWRGDDVDTLAAGVRADTAPSPEPPRGDDPRPDYGDDPNRGGLLHGWTDDWWPLRNTDPRRMDA